MISFGYKFYERISSLNTGNLLKRAGSRVKGVCSGVQAAFPELALNTSHLTAQPRGHYVGPAGL